MWCKLQVETPSAYTYSLFWAELSRLLGEKIPVAIVGLEPGTPGPVVQRFTHLATKQPRLGLLALGGLPLGFACLEASASRSSLVAWGRSRVADNFIAAAVCAVQQVPPLRLGVQP